MTGAGPSRRSVVACTLLPLVVGSCGAPAPTGDRPSTTDRTGAPATVATPLAEESDVTGSAPLLVIDPGSGRRMALTRSASGGIVAFNTTCTHGGCQVGYSATLKALSCPCHGGRYDFRTGAVLAGPPPRPLAEVAVRVVGTDVVLAP